MKKYYLLIFILVISLLQFPKSVIASHFAGCDLTYTCLGGNDYLITLAFYRDCSGIPVENTYDVNFTSSCLSFTVTLSQVPGTGNEITPTCPSASTTCSPPGTLWGLQQYIYQKQITIPPCSDWTMSFTGNARNPSNNVSNAGSTDWYIEATLNNALTTGAPCNSSPQFSNLPAVVVCQGQYSCYNHGAIDPDGDSLVYYLVAPLQAAGTPVGYMGGYSALNPLPSIPPVSVDPVTGDVCMTPTSNFIAAVAVKVEEWRRIGGIPTRIGTMLRDMQINIVTCNNLVPTIAGINPSATQYNVNDTIYAIEYCLGDTIDFHVYPFDANIPAQNLTLTWNSGITGGIFTVTGNGTPTPVGHFHWLPTSSAISNTSQCFTVNVKDDACPYIGQQTLSYCITIKGMKIDLVPSNDSLLCMGESYTIIAYADSNTVNYYWTVDGNPATPINDSTFLINSTTLGVGTHTIGCKVDDGTTTICPGFDAVTIKVVPQPDVNLGPDQIVCQGQNVTIDAGSGQTFLWSNGDTTQTIHPTSTGLYMVLVDGGHNTRCKDTNSVNIRFLAVPTINLGPDLCLTHDTILDAGYPGFQYNWIPGNLTTQTYNVDHSGRYIAIVAEEFGHGCQGQDTINISINPTPSIFITATDIDGKDISATDIEMCSHHTVNLTVKENPPSVLDNPNYVYTYYWTLTGNGSLSANNTRTISATCLPVGPHDIQVYVTGCEVVDALQHITSKLCELELPNVITPNGDKLNDKFEIKGIESFPNSTVQVFDRWGKKIFESKNYDNSENVWTGEKSADGVYYYVLTVNYGSQNTCMEAKNYNGTITIIR